MATRRSPVEGGPAAETRRRLLEAARHAFAAKGYAATSVSRDVLQATGVSVGSFYHQFADKAELFVAVVEDATAAAQRSIARTHVAPDLTTHDVAREGWARLLAMADAHEDLFRIVSRERTTPEPAIAPTVRLVRDGWVRTLADSYRSLVGTAEDFPADAAAEIVIALGSGIVDAYLDLPPDQRAERRDALVADLATFTVAGIGALARRSRPAGDGAPAGDGDGGEDAPTAAT